jgi:uncharacterized protein (DUF1810 family)
VADPYNLQRFLDAHKGSYDAALAELEAGSKKSHWMWFIFPQLAGLGSSPNAQYYAISSLDEARAYLVHPILGTRLRECVRALIRWKGKRSAEQILGNIDALKLRSSLTLFSEVEPSSSFADGLTSFFNGEPDERTLALLNGGQ